MDEWFYIYFFSSVSELAHQWGLEKAELNIAAWDTFSC